MRKVKLAFILIFIIGSVRAQKPIYEFYDAYNEKNWQKVDQLLHPGFVGTVNGRYHSSREEFYEQLKQDDIWFAEWKIIEITKAGKGAYLVKGTFVDEYQLFLYDNPVEGLWTYYIIDGKISRLEWEKFPSNPKVKQGKQREAEFFNWVKKNHPGSVSVLSKESYEDLIEFRNLLRLYVESLKK